MKALALVAVISALGLVAAHLASRENARHLRAKFTGNGHIFIVDRRQLHIECAGQGWPTLVLEAGLGDAGTVWDQIFTTVTAITRTCRYDRAGYGGSEAGPFPRTAERIVGDLHALLAAVGESGPFIMAAHSIGGLMIRDYATRYPAEISGLLFLDASHEDQYRAGIPDGRGKIATDPAPLLAMLDWPAGVSADALWTKRSEALQFDAYGVAAQGESSLGDRPILIVTAGGKPPALLSVWLDLQARLTELSTNSAQWIDKRSGHYLQRERPALVIVAMRCMVDAVRNRTRVADCPIPESTTQ